MPVTGDINNRWGIYTLQPMWMVAPAVILRRTKGNSIGAGERFPPIRSCEKAAV